MEAARTLTALPARVRRHRFTRACEELRPLGIAYVLRQFGRSLDLADAEDVVAEVIIRFDRLDAAGRPPERLRPAFFQSTRNAALDLLRYRGVRPTAPLEAAATHITEAPSPEERAESHENVVRLREAMARMRPNYREAIVLRFGLGMSVPEISERLGISLPAAKKLVLRSTAQIRDRMEAIDGRRFCPEMREIAERSVLDGELAGVEGDYDQVAAIKAHLEHCGPCRGFLAALRSDLHELGGGLLLAGIAGGKLGLPGRLASAGHSITHAFGAGVDRARLASYRASGALAPERTDSAGLLAGTGQKIVAACTAGAAGAATCVATGIVGPGLGVAPTHHPEPHPATPPAHVRKAPKPVHHPTISYSAPGSEVEHTESEPTISPVAPQPRGGATKQAEAPKEKKAAPKKQHPEPAPEPKPETAEETEQSEFGFEEEAQTNVAPPSEETAAPLSQSRSVETTAPSSSSSSESSKSTGGSSSSGGQEEFGFGG
jgi:RNA polymerase sigma factor (sigma-70 family)